MIFANVKEKLYFCSKLFGLPKVEAFYNTLLRLAI